MRLDQILDNPPAIIRLRILSFEMNIYLVELQTEETRDLVRDELGKPQRFQSVSQIKEVFSECDVQNAELVHESPYDEMIGNPPKAASQMVLPIQFNVRS